ETLKALDLKSPLHLCGHPFRHTVDGVEYIYCGQSFPNLRVKADWASVTADPAESYEAYVPLDRDADGKLAWAWRRGGAPVEIDEQERRARAGKMKPDEMPFRLRDAATRRDLHA